MTTQVVEWLWLDERDTISSSELARICGLTEQELGELIEYGALAPLDTAAPEPVFKADCVTPLRTAGKMRADYDLDLFTMVLLLDSLNRIDTLERKVRTLEATAHSR
jgi:chaperone modulatory protein CbpM